MTLSVKLTDGTKSIDLVYNASSQTNYALQYGGRITPPEPAVLLHQSPDGDSLPIRAYDEDREAYFSLDIIGTDQDELLEKIAELRRWIDGADQQALRSYLTRDTKPIYLEVQPDSATYATLHRVKWGWIDDGGAFYQSTKLASGKLAPDVVLMLHLEPYGQAANSLTIQNICPSSPHAVEDTNSDGVADGWATTGTYPAYQIATSHYLVGGQSQRMNCTTNGEDQAISCPLAICSNTDNLKAYIWIASNSTSNDVITLIFRSGTGESMDSKSFNPANPTGYDAIITNPPGGSYTWYRYSFTSSARSGANARIRVVRQSGAASAGGTYYVDAAYITDATFFDANVLAFGSTWQIKSRGDLSTGNEDRIPYIDVWGIPGDIPALLNLRVNPSNIGAWAAAYLTSDMGEKYPIGRFIRHWVEDDELTYDEIGAGSWSSRTSDSSRTDGGYRRYSGGTQADSFSVTLTITGDAAKAMCQNDKRMFAILRSSSPSDVEYRVSVQSIIQNDWRHLGQSNYWEILDLGLIKTQDLIPDNCPPDGTITLEIILHGSVIGSTSGTVDVDAFIFMPVNTFLCHQTKRATGNIYYDSRVTTVTYNNGLTSYDALGTFPEPEPGPTTTRIFWLPFGSDGDFDPDAYANTWLYLWPRTRHLLGAK